MQIYNYLKTLDWVTIIYIFHLISVGIAAIVSTTVLLFSLGKDDNKKPRE